MSAASASPAVVTPRRRRRLRLRAPGLLVLPAVAFLVLLFVWPVAEMAGESLRPSGQNYVDVFESDVYVRVLLRTFRTAAIVTLLCLLLGYPYAYAMHIASPRVRALLAVMVLLPFWSSMLVRTYAWQVLLQDTGVINWLLLQLGLIAEPLRLIRTSIAVTIGMSHVLLPYMVLPLYAAMRRIDPELVRAAAGLGAPPSQAFRRVFLPLSLPGVYAGALLVFVVSLGYYITPALLGSPRDALLGELVVSQVQQFQYGVASALGMVLLGVTLILLLGGARVARPDRFAGADRR